jgi:hypothetical protein
MILIEYFSTICLVFRYCLVYCFIYYLYCLFLAIVVSKFHCSRRFKTIRYKTLSSSKLEARQVFLDHIDPICFLPLVHTIACIP